MTGAVFLPLARPADTPRKAVALLLDGSKKHVTADVAQKKSLENGVCLVIFPSQQTDIIQPLDISVLRALKAAQKKSQLACMSEHPRQTATPTEFVLLTSAVEEAIRNLHAGTRVGFPW